MKKIMLSIIFCFTTVLLSAQYIYKIKADSVLITNDSCTAELNLENRTKDTIGFLFNKGKGRTEFRRMVKKIDSVTYVIGGLDTIRTGGSVIGNYILNQYTAKQNARAWIDTLKSIKLISDTLSTKIIDAGGSGNAFAPDLNTGVWIRPKVDEGNYYPYLGYESAKPSLSIGHYNGNFGTDSTSGWQNSTPLYVYRFMDNTNQARMNGASYGWGNHVIYGYNFIPTGVFRSGLTLDTSSTPYTFGGDGHFFNGNVLEASYGIGASKDVSGTIKFIAGNSPPHAFRMGVDFNPYFTPTQQYDGFWYNAISHMRYGGGPNSYIDRFAHYYAQPFLKQTGYGHIKSGYAFYAGALYQDGVDRPWGFYSEGINDRNYFAGQVMIGDTTVSNAGTNKLYVSGNSKITGYNELGNYLKLGSLSSDPTGSNGMLYYNNTNNKFRGYQNGAWTDLIGGGGSQTLQQVFDVETGEAHLNKVDTIDVGSNYLLLTGSGGGNILQARVSTASGVALSGVSSVNATGVSGTTGANGVGVWGIATGGLPGAFTGTFSSTNTSERVLSLDRVTSGSAANNIAGHLQLAIGSAQLAKMEWKKVDVSVNTGELNFYSNNAGSEEVFMNMQKAGVIRVNNNNDTLATKAYARSIGGGGSSIKQAKAITLVSPTSSENVTVFYTTQAITIEEVRGVMLGSSQSITLTVNYGSSRASATGTIVANNTFDFNDIGYQTTGFAFSLNTTSIPAGSYIWLTTSATSGTINDLNITLTYRQ